MELFLSAIGLAMIIEGLPYFVFPDQIKELAKRLPSMSNNAIRMIGIIIIAIGLIVIYLGRIYF